MKAGIQISRFNFGKGKAIAPTLKDIAQASETAGFSTIAVMDHYFQIQMIGPYTDPMMEAYTTLSFLAAHTNKVKLGTLVTGIIYRNPAFLVKQVTALDVLSNGRAFLGIGAAWNELEAKALGFPFPTVKDRFEMLEENLQIAKQMWSDTNTSYNGKYYALTETYNNPQPLTKPYPPILIGGSGEQKTLKLVAKYADACNLFAQQGIETVQHKLDVLKKHCDDEKRDYTTIQKTVLMHISKDMKPKDILHSCKELAEIGINEIYFGIAEMEKITPIVAFGKQVVSEIDTF